MNVVFSSDDNYARHAGISITSLYENNQNTEEINVFLIDDYISNENHQRLDSIAHRYGREISYIPFANYKKNLQLNNKWELPISAYARLFVAEMVPADVDRLLYLDCDTVICDSLQELWNTDLHGNTIGAVEDVASCVFREETGIAEPFRYFCSGIILIDLKKWRETDAQQRLLDYLDSKNGVVRHHDQTILNGVFWNDCYMLHPRYDALTPTFVMSYQNLRAYFRLWDLYYSKREIKESIRKPAIIHFTSSNVGRPWENNKHPKAKVYQEYWRKSEWCDIPMCGFKPSYDKKQRRIFWLYQHVPVGIIRMIGKIKGKISRKENT